MGNRMIQETIRTSRSVNGLNDFQFRVWTYLITYVDDYGRGSADPELLKGFVFPRIKSITEEQIRTALEDLERAGMIALYAVDGESFFYFPNWDKYQRIQAKRSKFPDPGNRKNAAGNGRSRKATVSHGDSPPEKEIEKEIETETEGEGEIPPNSPPAGDFEKFWAVYPKKVGKQAARKAFERIKGVPVETMIRAVEYQRSTEQWRKNNGEFIPHPTSWLNRGGWEDEIPQYWDSSASAVGSRPYPRGGTDNPFMDMLREMERGESG